VADGGAQDRHVLGGQSMGVLARKFARARGDVLPLPFTGDAAQLLSADVGQLPPLGVSLGFAGADTAPPAQNDLHTRAWRMALARAARDQLKMTVGFARIGAQQTSLTEVLETPMQRALIVMLQGQGEGMGLMVISGHMLAAMIEILTLTRLSADGPSDDDLRKPTRTDAAMAVEFIDAALAGLEKGLVDTAAADAGHGLGGPSWARGYRYAAFIDDPRPLHLMLEDCDYHLLSADLALEDGTRTGTIMLALPCAPEAAVPFVAPAAQEFDFTAPEPVQDFTQELRRHVQDLPVRLDAVIAQISVPLERILRLQVGEVVALPLAALDQISVLGMDGRCIARARLGQNRGMRALRLTDMPDVPHMADGALAGADFGAPLGQGAGANAVLQTETSAHIMRNCDDSVPSRADTPDFGSDFRSEFGANISAGSDPDFANQTFDFAALQNG